MLTKDWETVEAFVQAAYDGGFKKVLTPAVAAAMSNIIDEARRQDVALAEARGVIIWYSGFKTTGNTARAYLDAHPAPAKEK